MRGHVVGIAVIPLLLSAWRYHPIHAARVELDVSTEGRVAATVRVYRDDFPPGEKLPDIAAYVDRTIVLADGHSAIIPLRVSGVATEGDRLRISLAGAGGTRSEDWRIAVRLLQERFADQVNVLEARLPGRHAQLVFLKGDAPQALR